MKKTDCILHCCSIFEMKYIILILYFFPLAAQHYPMVDSRFNNKVFLNYDLEQQKVQPLEIKLPSPQKALLLSAIMPGAGQIYNKSPWWKSSLFFSFELAAVSTWINWENTGENYRLRFEAYADDHWTAENWYITSQKIFPDNWQDILIGTHHLTLKANGNYYSSDQLTELLQIYSWSELKLIRDRDFYENIGKYDQFVGGWDDPYDNPYDSDGNWYTEFKGNSNETVILTLQKNKYRGIRHKSNIYKTQVKFVLTAIMFNHLLSAADAFFGAHKKVMGSSNTLKIELVPDFRDFATLNGVRINFKW